MLATVWFIIAVVLVALLAHAVRNPAFLPVAPSVEDVFKRESVKLRELSPVDHPRIHGLVRTIGDAEVELRARRIITLLMGVERDEFVCVPGARRMRGDEDDALIILPDLAVMEKDPTGDGSISSEAFFRPDGKVKPTLEMRNRLVDAALVERKALLARVSAMLLDEQRMDVHVKLHERAQLLDRALLAAIQRIAVACSVQRDRLGLQFKYRYNGLYSSEFVSSDQI